MEKLPKLPYGEGSFSYHKSGNIYYRKRIKLPDGTSKDVGIYAPTVKECMNKMKAEEKKLTTVKVNPQSSKEVLADAMSYWLVTVKKPKLKTQSYTRLCSTYRNQIDAYDIGHQRYQSITTDELQEHINALNNKNYSHSVIKKTYDLLNDFYRYSSIKYKFDNPMLLVVMPTKDNITAETKDIQWFEQDDIDKFVAEAHATWKTGNPRYQGSLVYAANIYMGLRIGELLALQWQDIDFEKGTVYINKTLIEENNPDYDENDPDSRKVRFTIQPSNKTNANRYVPLNSKAKELLLEHQKRALFNEPTDYVISTRNRKTTTIKNADDTVKAMQENAGTTVQKASTHTLRHTCASLLYKKGVPSEIIAKILGNSREVLVKTYIHFEEQQMRDAVTSMVKNYLD